MTSQFQLQRAARIIEAGGVICYPTETVYGLGCDPLDPVAVSRLLQIKNRNVNKGLILIADSFDQLAPYIDAKDKTSIAKITNTEGGPVTWVVPASADTPYWLTGGRNTLAIRITHHPLARKLCEKINFPLVSTSANRSGKPTVTNCLQARLLFGKAIDAIICATKPLPGKPSEIRDLHSGKILRNN